MSKHFKIEFLSVIFIVSVIFIGCTTTPVAYSLSAANGPDFSSISFHDTFQSGKPNVTFVSFDGQSLPNPEKKTHWDPINFPSGRELKIIVHASYSTSSKTTLGGFGLLGAVVNTVQDVRAISRNVDTDVIFISPPLESGKNYLLTFVKEPGMPGKNILTLSDKDTGQVIQQQEFSTILGGDEAK